MKTQFFTDLTHSLTDDFYLAQENLYNIKVIDNWLNNPLTTPLSDELSIHNHVVETRNRIHCLINAIKDYENTNRENTDLDDSLGCD